MRGEMGKTAYRIKRNAPPMSLNDWVERSTIPHRKKIIILPREEKNISAAILNESEKIAQELLTSSRGLARLAITRTKPYLTKIAGLTAEQTPELATVGEEPVLGGIKEMSQKIGQTYRQMAEQAEKTSLEILTDSEKIYQRTIMKAKSHPNSLNKKDIREHFRQEINGFKDVLKMELAEIEKNFTTYSAQLLQAYEKTVRKMITQAETELNNEPEQQSIKKRPQFRITAEKELNKIDDRIKELYQNALEKSQKTSQEMLKKFATRNREMASPIQQKPSENVGKVYAHEVRNDMIKLSLNAFTTKAVQNFRAGKNGFTKGTKIRTTEERGHF